MKVVSFLRSLMHPFLRAHPLQLWLQFKTSRFARRFARFLVANGDVHVSEPHHSVGPRKEQLRRILFVCDNMWERRVLLPELDQIAEVDFIDVAEFPASRRKSVQPVDADHFAEKLASLKKREYDLAMVYLRSSLLSESLFYPLREACRAPLIGLNLDDKTSFEDFEVFRRSHRPYREWAKYFDCNLSSSKSMIEAYHANGLPCLYMPPGFHFDPKRTTLTAQQESQYSTTFVGSYKPERGEFIEGLRRIGIKVTLFGSGWKDAQFAEDDWRIYSESQINLGLGYNVNGKQVTNLKSRDFECPGAGGCYLTTFDWELAELFRIGEEILCYRDIYDLAEVWSFYIKRPEKCREIARAGQQRALKEHTWEQRFRAILSELGFNISSR